MEHPLNVPESQRQLVGVYTGPEAAEEARRRLVAAGVPASAIDVGGHRNEVASLRSEMRQELEGGMVTAIVTATREANRGRGIVIAIAWVVALVVLLPFSFIDWGLTFWGRVLVLAIVAMVAGFAYGLVMGAGVAARRPDEPMAAHRGVTVRVPADAPGLRDAMTFDGLIRLDEVTADDEPVGTVTTEEEVTAEAHDGVVDDIAANFRQGHERSAHDRPGDTRPPSRT